MAHERHEAVYVYLISAEFSSGLLLPSKGSVNYGTCTAVHIVLRLSTSTSTRDELKVLPQYFSHCSRAIDSFELDR